MTFMEKLQRAVEQSDLFITRRKTEDGEMQVKVESGMQMGAAGPVSGVGTTVEDAFDAFLAAQRENLRAGAERMEAKAEECRGHAARMRELLAASEEGWPMDALHDIAETDLSNREFIEVGKARPALGIPDCCDADKVLKALEKLSKQTERGLPLLSSSALLPLTPVEKGFVLGVVAGFRSAMEANR